ncbi:MAG: hypothetical protein NT011_04785 [Kiritimatiellaeota bacterium]|nr:hypothetical protein [Kiritimatiellota bacterium]
MAEPILFPLQIVFNAKPKHTPPSLRINAIFHARQSDVEILRSKAQNPREVAESAQRLGELGAFRLLTTRLRQSFAEFR